MARNNHSAEDAALGFLYQGQYALLLLWREDDDEATVQLETLDDVVLSARGITLLEQLKHSLKEKPTPITIASVQLWKTLKAWIDVLHEVDLSHTWFHLISVADVAKNSPLEALLNNEDDRQDLFSALTEEAERVKVERANAAADGKVKLPHEEKIKGCEAFLSISDTQKKNMISRIRMKPNQPDISGVDAVFAKLLVSVQRAKRTQVARQTLDWWNGQILDSLTKRRSRGISRAELIEKYTEIVTAIQMDELTSSFANAVHPSSHRTNKMIEQQIALVAGSTELSRAIREEWRARSERARWSEENPTKHEVIRKYDDRLVEEWEDRHKDMQNACTGKSEQELKEHGLEILNWSHYNAHREMEQIAPKITSPYYVRGTYQILSVEGNVGWHPNYRKMLGFEK